ncbi:Protein of unknown function (DUF2435) [Carpediemonas membranifera]|uniref:RNA polymerase II assembly factor Rtp1 C-terminal domain-containing protein n=1 Tax=Carpediemonas membranifera TaxID=201153 RepID=A0A8J6E079_9EUKA|nr:Protein of unknown function (DUF2435) [Carpediemonas membranifera]|eukprot:KAG9391793.1 Protein of unknown function (DUF2435) [Carpediemonas membranifera]
MDLLPELPHRAWEILRGLANVVPSHLYMVLDGVLGFDCEPAPIDSIISSVRELFDLWEEPKSRNEAIYPHYASLILGALVHARYAEPESAPAPPLPSAVSPADLGALAPQGVQTIKDQADMLIQELLDCPVPFAIHPPLVLVGLTMAVGSETTTFAKGLVSMQSSRPSGLLALYSHLGEGRTDVQAVDSVASIAATFPVLVEDEQAWLHALSDQICTLLQSETPVHADLAARLAFALCDRYGQAALPILSDLIRPLRTPQPESTLYELIEALHHLVTFAVPARLVCDGLRPALPVLFHLYVFLRGTVLSTKTAVGETLVRVIRHCGLPADAFKEVLTADQREVGLSFRLGDHGSVMSVPFDHSQGGDQSALDQLQSVGEEDFVGPDGPVVDAAAALADLLPRHVAGNLMLDFLAAHVARKSRPIESDGEFRQEAVLERLCDTLGPKMVTNTAQVCGVAAALLDSADPGDLAGLAMVLTVLLVALESGDRVRYGMVSGMIAQVERLTRYPPEAGEVPELARIVYAAMIALPISEGDERAAGAGASVDEILAAMRSTVLPDRVWAIAQLEDAVRTGTCPMPVEQCVSLFENQLRDDDGYMVGAALSGLVTLTHQAPDQALGVLAAIVTDTTRPVEQRSKVCEALYQMARSLGPAVMAARRGPRLIATLLTVAESERTVVVASALLTLASLLRAFPMLVLGRFQDVYARCDAVLKAAPANEVDRYNRLAAAQLVFEIVDVSLGDDGQLWHVLGSTGRLRATCSRLQDDAEAAVAQMMRRTVARIAEFSDKFVGTRPGWD